jgi:hypothetical protein
MPPFRKLPVVAAATALLSLTVPAAPAWAVTFTWLGGTFVSGTTAPSPLLAPDVLNISSGANKVFFTSFTNSSQVNWQDGAIFLGGSASVVNGGVWDAQNDSSLLATSGGGSFTNNGTLRKSGGTGVTTIASGVGFTNSGTIDAQTGTVRLAGGPMVFNAGSVFTGAGKVEVTANAAFNGSLSSSNLELASGTQTGTGAVINGVVAWRGATLAGTWQVAAGQTLNMVGNGNRVIFDAGTVVTNAGTANWQAGTVFIGGSASVVNNGVWDAQNDSSLLATSGGGSFTNNGTLRKSGGTGATTIGAWLAGRWCSTPAACSLAPARLKSPPMLPSMAA